jgi:small subunit ribosomal protein S8
MITDPLADFLTMIRNASRCASKDEVVAPYSKLKSDVAHIMKAEGYLDEVEMLKGETSKPELRVKINRRGRNCAITDIKRMSKPGLRRYVQADDIPNVLGGMGIAIVSTSRGVMAGHHARKRRLGGELLCTIH